MKFNTAHPIKLYLLLISICFTYTVKALDIKDGLPSEQKNRPNIVLIMTDDQGWGDIGFHNNHHIKTPIIDKLATESIRLTNFYVSPVCAPTRSSLMTGRYSLRTGMRDTYNGGAIMSTDEITLAEILKHDGYNTAMFGKWHLGDNYPTRPQDQGFEEALNHLSGGVGQPGDYLNFFKGDSSYFNPTLMHNGTPKKSEGYCSDVYTDAAIEYIEKQSSNNPFFIYLAFNAPHDPLQLPQEYYDIYKDIDPSEGFSSGMAPEMSEESKEAARKVYGMVTNIDDNVGRVIRTLENSGISDNTIIIFMTDNGPAQARYIGGMRGRKGSVYSGGIRVPCYIHYPNFESSNREISFPTAHIDIVPTLLELAGSDLPSSHKIDGISIAKQLKDRSAPDPKSRPLFFYWTRRGVTKYNNIAVQEGNYKLVGHCEHDSQITDFELFKIWEDSSESSNIIDKSTPIAELLKDRLDSWYSEMILSPNMLNRPRAIIGTEHEPVTTLNLNDAAGQEAIWADDEVFGYWDVKFDQAGEYDVKCTYLEPLDLKGDMKIEIGPVIYVKKNKIEGSKVVEFKNVFIPEIEGEFKPWFFSRVDGEFKSRLPFKVEIKRSNN